MALQARYQVAAADIDRVRIGTYRPALDIACYDRPASANEARFSLKYVVASALVYGSVRMAAYEPARLDDPATRALMELTEVAVDAELDAAFPDQRAARIEFDMKDGRRLSYLQPNRKGDPEEPLSDADLSAKFLELSGPIIGAERSRSMIERLWQLELAQDLLA